MVDNSFPESGDADDPENFGEWMGQEARANYIEFGLEVENVDYGASTFDLTEGKFFVLADSVPAATTDEIRRKVIYMAKLDARTDIPFATASGLNHVWADVNPGSDNNPTIEVNSSGVIPSETALKIAEIYTDTESINPVNRDPHLRAMEIIRDGDSMVHFYDTGTSNFQGPIEQQGNAVATEPWVTENFVQPGQPAPMSIPFTKWADGLSGERIHQMQLSEGEQLEVNRLEIRTENGQVYNNLEVEIYDGTFNDVIASTNELAQGDLGSSEFGATVNIRLTNQTGNYRVACINADLRILG